MTIVALNSLANENHRPLKERRVGRGFVDPSHPVVDLFHGCTRWQIKTKPARHTVISGEDDRCACLPANVVDLRSELRPTSSQRPCGRVQMSERQKTKERL